MPEDNAADQHNGSAVPAPVRSFLSSDETITRRVAIFRANGAGPLDAIKLGRLLNALYDKEISFEAFSGKVLELFPGNGEAAKKLVLELAGKEMLVIADYLGDVDGFIRSLGGDPASYPATRITFRAMTAMDVVSEVLHENPANVPAYLEHRLREILESRVRNVRKDEETVQRLTRAEKIGGVEMNEEEARRLVEKLAAKAASVQIAADEPPTAPEAQSVSIPVAAAVAPSVPAVKPAFDRRGDGIAKEDEHEAETIRGSVLSRIITPEVSGLEQDIVGRVESLCASYANGLDADSRARLRSALDSRLRGVRGRSETEALFLRGAQEGGAGLSPAAASALAEEMEKAYRDIHERSQAVLKEEKAAFVKGSIEGAAAKDQSRRLSEQEELDRMYGALTGKRKSAGAKPSAVAPVNAPAPSDAANPYMYRPPAANPLPPRPAKTMSDIRPPAAALMGPVEELRSMTLEDFRRLSADPSEACRKIGDKLDLLEEHSFAQRIEGVKAWRESEVHRLYLKTITASFSGGKPIQAIIAQAISANEPTPTEREVHAIMELNRQLKA